MNKKKFINQLSVFDTNKCFLYSDQPCQICWGNKEVLFFWPKLIRKKLHVSSIFVRPVDLI